MLWDYDEQNLTLANSARDAEIKLDPVALVSEPIDRLPSVPVRVRVGPIFGELVIRRKYARNINGPDFYDTIWWCIDFNGDDFCDRQVCHRMPARLLDAKAWSSFVDAAADGLRALMWLKPRTGNVEFVHFAGGRVGSEWIVRSFRSFGFPTWYPGTRDILKVRERETTDPQPISADGWQFEDGERPRMVHAPSGEIISHEGAQIPSPTELQVRHWFRYAGKFGEFRLPVINRLLSLSGPRPRVWEIECRAPFEIAWGSPRDRTHPARLGSARISQAQWGELRETLVGGLLRWPACEATGSRPLWLMFDRDYQEGSWSSVPVVVGHNVAVTALGS